MLSQYAPVALGSLLVLEHLFVYTVVGIRVEVVVFCSRLLRCRALLIRRRLRLFQGQGRHTHRQAARAPIVNGRGARSHTRNDGENPCNPNPPTKNGEEQLSRARTRQGASPHASRGQVASLCRMAQLPPRSCRARAANGKVLWRRECREIFWSRASRALGRGSDLGSSGAGSLHVHAFRFCLFRDCGALVRLVPAEKSSGRARDSDRNRGELGCGRETMRAQESEKNTHTPVHLPAQLGAHMQRRGTCGYRVLSLPSAPRHPLANQRGWRARALC